MRTVIRSMVAKGWYKTRGLITNETGSFWREGNILCLDYGGRFITMFSKFTEIYISKG